MRVTKSWECERTPHLIPIRFPEEQDYDYEVGEAAALKSALIHIAFPRKHSYVFTVQ
jgi:hypothetical protein